MQIGGYKLEPGADLREADLSGLDLRGVDLSGADLYRADLSGSDLSSANLHRACLIRGRLSETNIGGTDFSCADLRHTTLWRATGDRGANFSFADLRYAELSDADLHSANLEGADCSHAKMRNVVLGFMANYAIFDKADLSGAVLDCVHWSDASFRGTNFDGAEVGGSGQADFKGAIFSETTRIGGNWSKEDFTNVVYKESDQIH